MIELPAQAAILMLEPFIVTDDIHVEGLVLGTRKELLADNLPKKKKGMSAEAIAKMEQEMEALEQHDLKAVEECYGENMLTRQLRHQLRAAPDAPARPRAAARAKRPKAILRRDQAQHERAHPLLRPATSQLVRDRMARTGRHINPDLRLWTDREDNLLGTGRDEQIARDAS